MDAPKQERILAARTLVAAPILVSLADNCEKKGDHAIAAKIRDSINPDWNHVGEIVISDAVLQPFILHLRLSKVPSGYAISTAVPENFERSLREKFRIFTAAVRAFWKEWLENLPEGLSRDYFAETMIESETAFHWKDDDSWWVGIMNYYTDVTGKKFKVK